MPERVKFQIARGWMEETRKRSGAKKPAPAAGPPSCNNSGRGKKLFTMPSKFILVILSPVTRYTDLAMIVPELEKNK